MLFFSCSCTQQKTEEGKNLPHMLYNLKHADAVYHLPASLNELSGLASTTDNTLLAVNDEQGILYSITLKPELKIKEYAWGKNGDYEGVAAGSKYVYVLESNGTVHTLSKNEYSVVSSYTVKPAAEWEGADFAADTLLLVQKKAANATGVWYFTNNEEKLKFKINIDDIAQQLLATKLDKKLYKLIKGSGLQSAFAASALAIHPITRDIYILSAEQRLLVVYQPGGKLKQVMELPADIFLKPEAITFSKKGALYIGSEGVNTTRPALIFKYLYDPE